MMVVAVLVSGHLTGEHSGGQRLNDSPTGLQIYL